MDAGLLVECLKREAALSSTYDKGFTLAKHGAAAKLDMVSGSIGSTVLLSARVEGSRGALYQTEVSLDLNDSEVVDYNCTCIAAASYPGMCKHEVALVLEYLARKGLGPVADAKRNYVLPTSMPMRARGVPSSPQIAQLMEGLVARRSSTNAPARTFRHGLNAETVQPVELSFSVVPAGSSGQTGACTWGIKLRIGRGSSSYVVKDIASLAEAWRAGAEASYGKNLSFAHTPAAFSKTAHAILEIVSRVVESQRAFLLSHSHYQATGRGIIKELSLSDADLIELFDAAQGGEFTFEPNDGPYGTKGKPRRMKITVGDPEISSRMEAAQDGGFDLRFDGSWWCLASGERLYVLGDGAARRCTDEFAAQARTVLPQLLPSRGALHIAAADLPDFCRSVLPALRAATDLEAPASLDRIIPPEASFTFKIGLDDGRVTCDARVAYGAWETALYGEARVRELRARYVPDPARKQEPSRDMVAEYRVMDVVEELFPGGVLDEGDLPEFDEDDDELLYILLTEGVAELRGLGEVLLSDRLRSIQIRESPDLSVRAVVHSGLLDLEVNTSGLSNRDLAAYLASYRRRQRFVRLTNGDIMRLGEGVAALDDLAGGLGVEPEELAEGVTGLATNRVLFVDALLKRAHGLHLSRNDGFRAIVRDFDTFSDADFEVPASLAQTLRPYQRDGFRWLEMLDRFGFGGILADDMGLGKTLQVIAHLLARAEAGDGGTTLVVCPASLVYNWTAEFERFAPSLDAVPVVGTKTRRRTLIAAASEHDVLVTSYDLMRRDIADYTEAPFSRVILDEAQYIKNPGTQVAKAAKCLPSRTRLALTGTPIENRTAELWSIFDFLMPGVLGSRDAFAKMYESPIEGGDERTTARLRCLVAPFILRRLKTDVLADLPDKTESVVYARMTGEQDKLYRANQDRLALQVSHELPDEFKKKKLQVLAELTKLRQICCDPALFYEGYTGGSAKLDTCMELVASALDAGHRILLFSQFTTMLSIISDRLTADRVKHMVLTGATSKEERRRLVAGFQAGEAPVFLISLRAGGVGLNLTAADVVIHYDPWWNLAAQNQATDRAYRIGQERDVSVYKLICAGTIEERIVAMQESKRELAENLLSGEGVRSATLTRDDVLALLGE